MACVLHLERLESDLVASSFPPSKSLSPGRSDTLQSLCKEWQLCVDVLLNSVARAFDSIKFLQVSGKICTHYYHFHWPPLPAADVTVNMSVCWCTTKLVERRLLDLARSCRQSENVTLTDTLQTARSLCECAAMFSQVATCSSTTPASHNRANLETGKKLN